MLDRLDGMSREQFGEQPHHHLAVFEHVGDTGRHPQVVLEHAELPVTITNHIDAADVRVDVVRYVDALHLAAILGVAENLVGRNDTGLEDLLLVVDVGDKRIQRADTLLDASLQLRPFVRGKDPRHDIERDQPLGTRVLPIDGEGDAEPMEQCVGLRTLLSEAL